MHSRFCFDYFIIVNVRCRVACLLGTSLNPGKPYFIFKYSNHDFPVTKFAVADIQFYSLFLGCTNELKHILNYLSRITDIHNSDEDIHIQRESRSQTIPFICSILIGQCFHSKVAER